MRIFLILGALVSSGLTLHLGCNDVKARAVTAEPNEGQVAAAVAVAAGPSAEGEGFRISLRPVGTYSVGEPGLVELVLLAKAPYKCNEEYPHKFKVAKGEGVEFEQAVVSREAGQLSKAELKLPIRFKPTAAGSRTVAGQLAFSVCTDERCLIERRDLALVIDVK